MQHKQKNQSVALFLKPQHVIIKETAKKHVNLLWIDGGNK